MDLINLLKNIDYEIISGDISREIKGIESDSRKILPGFIFVAIKGESLDGHNYIDKAIENGAEAILVESSRINFPKDVTAIKVLNKNNRKNLPILINNFYNNLSFKLNVIGVTGTNGKSSITKMLSDAINSNCNKTSTIGTIENKVGSQVIESRNTTPGPIDINRIFKLSIDKEIKNCVMEVSSHGLAQDRVLGVDFNIGIFTNLTNEHMEFHKDMKDYFNAKAKLFEMSKGNVINNDDNYGKKLINKYKNKEKPLLTYGLTSDSDIYVENIKYAYEGTSCTLITPDFKEDIFINIPGEIYVYNTLAIVGSMILLGYSKDEIVNGINSFKNINGRFDKVDTGEDFDIIVDYAHSIDALTKVLTEINKFKKGRLITIFGCTGSRDKKKRPIMGKISSELSDITILTSDDLYDEDPNSIIEDILQGIESKKGIFYDIDRGKAIAMGIDMAHKDDIILIAGKGHESVQKVAGKRIPFNDKEFALKYLNERK